MNGNVSIATFLELDYQLSGYGAVLEIWTDLPGGTLARRQAPAIPSRAVRGLTKIPLAAAIKGQLWQFHIPRFPGQMRLFGGRIFCRALGRTPSDWAWRPIPGIEPTPEEWTIVKLPIEPTPEEWSLVKLPIPETPDDWQLAKLPIEPTPEEWSLVKIPFEPSDEVPQRADLVMDE